MHGTRTDISIICSDSSLRLLLGPLQTTRGISLLYHEQALAHQALCRVCLTHFTTDLDRLLLNRGDAARLLLLGDQFTLVICFLGLLGVVFEVTRLFYLVLGGAL